jgi:uncharacterized protein
MSTQKPESAIFLPLLALLFFLCLPAREVQARQIPPYQGYVNDYAEMISPAAEERLERLLRAFDHTDSTQIAILTIDSLTGDDLEEFSIRTVEAWKIGQRGKDNGILLLAVRDDRQVRIEVGRGLEGALTDLAAGRIIDRIMIPHFRVGRLDEGFEAGVEALILATRGEFNADRLTPDGEEPHPLITYFIFGGLIIAILGSVSRTLGMVSGALLLPLLFSLGSGSFPGLLILLLLLPAGAASGLLLPLVLAGFLRSRGGYHGGGYYRGGGGFGGGRRGGFGGFGGGGFGGGGASGRW